MGEGCVRSSPRTGGAGKATRRASAASPFAAAWDRYTGTPTGEPRLIETDERRTLEAMLLENLTRAKAATPGHAQTIVDADRSSDLHGRAGPTWLGPFRRYDDYLAALAAAGEGPAPDLDHERAVAGEAVSPSAPRAAQARAADARGRREW